MSAKCPSCGQSLKEIAEGRLQCTVCGKTINNPEYRPKAAQNAAYLLSSIGNEATDALQRHSDMRAMYIELKDRESRLRLNEIEFNALRSVGKMGMNLNAETEAKIKAFKLEEEKARCTDALRKIDIEIKSLLSRREDIISDLKQIDDGILPSWLLT
jgi:uncharacterized Zn finger protein (UPF0148 family)